MEDLQNEAGAVDNASLAQEGWEGSVNTDISNVDWSSNPENDEHTLKIKKLVEQFWSAEKLAEAKMNADRWYSKLESDKKAQEKAFSEKTYNYEKKLVAYDIAHLMDIYTEDYKLADRLSTEVYGKNIDDMFDEYMNSTIEWNNIMSQFNPSQKAVTAEDIEKLAEIKAMKKFVEKQKEIDKIEQTKNLKSTYSEFIVEKWFEKWSKEEKAFNDIYEDLIDWKEKNLKNIQKMLKISFDTFISDNKEYNDTLKKNKENLKNSAGFDSNNGKKWTGYNLDESDMIAMRTAGMTLEQYQKYWKN